MARLLARGFLTAPDGTARCWASMRARRSSGRWSRLRADRSPFACPRRDQARRWQRQGDALIVTGHQRDQQLLRGALGWPRASLTVSHQHRDGTGTAPWPRSPAHLFLAAVHRWQDGHGQPGGRAEAAAQGRRANCWTTELDLGSRRCSRHRRGPFPRQRGFLRFFRQRESDGALLAAAVHRSTARESSNYMVEPRGGCDPSP